MILKMLSIFITTIVLLPLQCLADNYEVSVTRKGSNIYKVDSKDIIIQTRYCYEYVHYEKSFLKMYGYTGEIIFTNSNAKCDIKAVYGKANQSAGKYSVTVSEESDDWYEIFGKDMYIKTSGCLSLALGEDGVLDITNSGYGTLYVGQNECMVEGIYSKLSL